MFLRLGESEGAVGSVLEILRPAVCSSSDSDRQDRNNICRMYNVPESTVRSMRKQNSEIKKNLALAKKYFSPSGVGNHSGGERSVKTVTDYNKVMIILEHYLLRWINR